MKTKQANGIQVTDAELGQVTAVFSRFNVKDHDGDVTLPGAFKDGTEVRISAYGHAVWQGAMPVGKGVIRTTDTEAILEGQFFMNTQAGRETFEVVKQLGDLQDWSYSVHPVKAYHGTFKGERVQFLEKLDGPVEVSPVLKGAGIDTGTLAVKGLKVDAPDYTDCKHHTAEDGSLDILKCQTGIAELNGARGPVSISDEDREGAYKHLADHLSVVDVAVSELRHSDSHLKLADRYLGILADLKEADDQATEIGVSRSEKGKTAVTAHVAELRELIAVKAAEALAAAESDEPVELKSEDTEEVSKSDASRDAAIEAHLRFIETSNRQKGNL